MLSQELLQYLSLIRYTSRVHKGLGWAIYDYKFRQKASRNKSLVWSIFESHLWLTIFTVLPAALIKEYPLFTKGPSSSSASFGASYEGTCINYDKSGRLCTRDECKYMQAHPQLMQVVIKDQNTVRRSRADRNRVATNLLLIRGPKSILFRNQRVYHKGHLTQHFYHLRPRKSHYWFHCHPIFISYAFQGEHLS